MQPDRISKTMLRCWLFLLPATALAVGFAPDQRRLAPNRTPFTALARTHAHGGVGCGVMVGPDLLLTCAHCVSDPQRQLYEDVEIELGLGFESGSRSARMKSAVFPKGGSVAIEAGQDWAIVQLDRPLGAYYGWLNCRYLTDAEWPEQEIELLGYCACPQEARPQFGEMDRPYRCPGAVSDVGPEIVFHNCAMWGGTSGAPLLAKNGDDYNVVGINFAGVDIEGEVLTHGFREAYKKEWANLAIPGRQWEAALDQIPASPVPIIKSVVLRNQSRRPISVKTNYHSVFAAPGTTPCEVQVVVPPGADGSLLERSHGCYDDEIKVRIDGRNPGQVKLPTSELVLVIR